MRIFLVLLLLPVLLFPQTITDKKRDLSQKDKSSSGEVQIVNDTLSILRKQLEERYRQAEELQAKEADEVSYKAVLTEVNQIRQEMVQVEERWRESAVSEAKRDEDGFALWDQEEATLAQLIMEYGSSEFLYIVPPEMASLNLKLNMHSNIPVPRESWSKMLEVIFLHNGIGVKKLNPYARQLFVLKQDLSAVRLLATKVEDLQWCAPTDRVFFLFSPPVEQVKGVLQFFEKFSDAKQTFVHQVGGKIALVAAKEEVEKLANLYNTVWEGGGGKVARVVSLHKISVKEMEKILGTFFGENLERARPPFGKAEHEGLGVFALGQRNSLVLMGSKSVVDRAEKIVNDTEGQLEDPAETTIYLYACRHSDPSDLAKVLEKVYIALLTAGQEVRFQDTDVLLNAQTPLGGRIPEGYPPAAPLVVAPTPIKPGLTAEAEIEQGPSEHFIPDPKTGTLLMTVRKDALPKIKDLLKKLDVPKKMVHIEVLLFERRIHSQNNFGLNLLQIGSKRNGLFYSSLHGPKPDSKGILQFLFSGNQPKFALDYNFLLTQDDLQLNAAPSTTAVNQTPAQISIVEERSINNGAAPVDTSSGTIAFEKSFSRAQFGITIKFTPTIHPPENEGEKGSVTLQTDINFDTQKKNTEDDRPNVDRRGIKNEVRITDGETIIIGGLRRKSTEDREEKVPFLGDIPGLGKIFGSTELTDHETEMFFFITPKILYDSKEELRLILQSDLQKRVGDVPEFLEAVVRERDEESREFFEHSLKTMFQHER